MKKHDENRTRTTTKCKLQITAAVVRKIQNKKERKPKSTNNLWEEMNISMLQTNNY